MAVLVVAVVAIVAIGTALRSRSGHDLSLLSTAQTAHIARFARDQARLLGDPRLGHATVIIGPQTMQATGGVRLTKSEAYIVLHGQFHCDQCHDPATAGLGGRDRWRAKTLGYTVSWPTLAVLGIGADTRPDGLNLPPAKTIKRLTVVKL